MRETKLREREKHKLLSHTQENKGTGGGDRHQVPLLRCQLPTCPILIWSLRQGEDFQVLNCWLHTIIGSCGQGGASVLAFPWGAVWGEVWAVSSVISTGQWGPWAQIPLPMASLRFLTSLGFCLAGDPRLHITHVCALAWHREYHGWELPHLPTHFLFLALEEAMLLLPSRLGWQGVGNWGGRKHTEVFNKARAYT